MMNKVVEYLLNTNKTLANAYEVLGINPKLIRGEDLRILDDEIFQCNGCGFWLEWCEEGIDHLCTECSEDI